MKKLMATLILAWQLPYLQPVSILKTVGRVPLLKV